MTIYNFPKNSELLKFILPMKIGWIIFPVVSGVEMKNLQISEQAHFLVLYCGFATLVSVAAKPWGFVLQQQPARRLTQ